MAVSARSAAATFRFETAPSSRGAIGAVSLRGDVDGTLRALGAAPVEVGSARVRWIEGVDELLVARWAKDAAHLFPHGGHAVAAALAERLEGIGARREPADALGLWPEAADEFEALMLATLARAASPLAVDLLLEQPRRWRAWLVGAPSDRGAPEEIRRHSAHLDRLVTPPLVAAIGASNIGKSSLLNALARREASLVADEPGTTRDYVGAALDLGGLVVNWIDCPGVREGASAVEHEARAQAEQALPHAALVVSCADAEHGWLADPPGVEVLRVGTRADLGRRAGAELSVSVRTGEGLDELVGALLERLVPVEARGYPGPWAFHTGLPLPPGFA